MQNISKVTDLWPLTPKLPTSVKPLEVLVLGLTVAGLVISLVKPKNKLLKTVIDYAPIAVTMLSAIELPKTVKKKTKKVSK